MGLYGSTGIKTILADLRGWITQKLGLKADSVHTHTKSQITDLEVDFDGTIEEWNALTPEQKAVYTGEVYIKNDINGSAVLDNVPTEGSQNAVKSGGVYAALDDKCNLLVITSKGKFSTTESYTKGSYVFKDGELYQFTSAKSAGVWDSSKVNKVTVLGVIDGINTSIGDIDYLITNIWAGLASKFNEDESYRAGDLIRSSDPDGIFYEFITNHTGPWNSSHVRAIKLAAAVREATYMPNIINPITVKDSQGNTRLTFTALYGNDTDTSTLELKHQDGTTCFEVAQSGNIVNFDFSVGVVPKIRTNTGLHIKKKYNSSTSQNEGGNLYVDDTVYTGETADYAEKFETLEDCPVGRFVTLDGEKIRLAQPGDDYILGVTSENPAFIGDNNLDGVPVGLLGKLWVEHDGTAIVNGYVFCGVDGKASKAFSWEEGYRVMAVDGNRCKILVK